MDTAIAHRLLRQHLELLKELGFLCVEPGRATAASNPPVDDADSSDVMTGESTTETDGAKAGGAMQGEVGANDEADGVSGSASAVETTNAAVAPGGPRTLHPEWPQRLFSAPKSPPLALAHPPFADASTLPAPEPDEALSTPGARIEALSDIAREVARCRACGLCAGRTNVVPGQGNPMARLVFVGEGPGGDEDLQGFAFVGKAGQILTGMVTSLGITRADVFICNVVKCRPPGNRTLEPAEMTACEPFLKRQLAILRPDIIVALGATALKCLLRDPKLGITRIRGNWKRYEGIALMPTFHPAYLLRAPSGMASVREDMAKVAHVFGLEGPTKPEIR